MKLKKGYLLLESVVSITAIVLISSMLYYVFIFSINIKTSTEDNVELQQQANEISNYIKGVIENSKGIINIENNQQFISTTSIQCKYKEDGKSLKDKEISLKENNNKLFVNTLNSVGNSEAGGYEIGDFVDKMYISTEYNGKIANVKLLLSKNKTKVEKEFLINIANFEGDF